MRTVWFAFASCCFLFAYLQAQESGGIIAEKVHEVVAEADPSQSMAPATIRLTSNSVIELSSDLILRLLGLSTVLNLMWAIVTAYWVFTRGGFRHVNAKAIIGTNPKDFARNRRELYRAADQLKADTRPVVMFGDSLTAGGLWSEWYGPMVLNRGIGGETTREGAERAADMAEIRPARVFIMLGVNDYRTIPPKETKSNMEAILQSIHKRSPATEIYVESLLPAVSRERGRWVGSVNHALHEAAVNNHAKWIDLYSIFADDDFIREGLTIDGIHLTARGYDLWRETLQPYVLAHLDALPSQQLAS